MMIKTVKEQIFRSPYQSLAAIFQVTLAFFIISIFAVIGYGSQKILYYFESRPQVNAYLKDEAKTQDIDSLKLKLEQTGKVSKIVYSSKEDALKIYREQNKDKPILLEMVTAKILPASLEVSTTSLGSLKEIAEMLKSSTIIEDVNYQEDIVTTLGYWIEALRKIGLVLGIFLFSVALLTILVILGVKISQKKEEIYIYKLLGATKWYIASPFYAEGIFYGIVSAIFSWSLTFGLILYLTPIISKFFNGIALFPIPTDLILQSLGGLLLLGTGVGFLGSFMAISRFLKSAR